MADKKDQLPTLAQERVVRTVPEASVLSIVQEARDIVAGKSDAAPRKEHLEALLISALFYKAKASALEEQQYPLEEIQAAHQGQLVHIPELESDCYQSRCTERAQYVLIGQIVPVLYCPRHAKQLSQWKGLVQ